MSKKDQTADTLPPPPLVAAPAFIDITDDPGCFDALRNFGLTVTQDVNPGYVVTFDDPVRVFVGDRIVRDAPGKHHVEKATNA